MPATFYATALVVLLLSMARGFGDSYAPSKPEAFSSPSGMHLVRIEAADSVENPKYYWKNTEFNVFSYNKETEDYERVTKFDVEGHPLRLFINDAGTRIVTIDQHFGVGYGQIAAIYDFDGKRLAQWELEDLFDVESPFDRRGLPNFRRSTSSIYWRGDVGWSFDQKTIWISAPTTFESHDDGSYTVTHPADMDSYEINLERVEMKRVPAKNKKEEQGGAGEPAPRSESDSERSDKPNPKAEGRSR
jgi:hypothetical protein